MTATRFLPFPRSLLGRVKEMTHKAFWDLLKQQLESEPPEFTQALSLMTEVKQVSLQSRPGSQGQAEGSNRSGVTAGRGQVRLSTNRHLSDLAVRRSGRKNNAGLVTEVTLGLGLGHTVPVRCRAVSLLSCAAPRPCCALQVAALPLEAGRGLSFVYS